MNIDPYTLMRTVDVLERLITFREGTYYHTEAEVQAKGLVEELLRVLKEGGN